MGGVYAASRWLRKEVEIQKSTLFLLHYSQPGVEMGTERLMIINFQGHPSLIHLKSPEVKAQL